VQLEPTRLLTGLCLLLLLAPVRADVGPGEMQIMARALSFLQKPPSGVLRVGVVFSPIIAESSREAEAVERILRDGLQVGNLTLKAVPVPLNEISRTNTDLLFLTGGLQEQGQQVAAVTRARHIPCVTTDLAQVRSGACALGIRSQPSIQILVNRATAVADGISFSTVFRMMITEI
jgi:hypothetical protein